MKATAIAPANIAFIKYWGKKDDDLRLPLNSSFSMNLSGAVTRTTVEFSPDYCKDTVELVGETFSTKEQERVAKSLDAIRTVAQISEHARVVTKNTFPKGAGAAASASGFAALTVAAFAAAGVAVAEKEMTVFARLGSGSACRSIPDGFVLWEEGNSSDSSFAYSLYPHTYWDIRDLLVIVDSGMKKVATSDGMKTIMTSPRFSRRLSAVGGRLTRMNIAMKEKNFAAFGAITEEDCLDMHTVMQSQVPPLMYWNDMTRVVMDAVVAWRNEGLPVYFTIDAGPNIHVLCEPYSQAIILKKLNMLTGVQTVIINTPAPGTQISEDHLF